MQINLYRNDGYILVTNKPKKETTVVILQLEKKDKMNSQHTKQHIRKPRHTSRCFSLQKSQIFTDAQRTD